MGNKYDVTNDIFDTSLELITNRIKELLDLLENTTIVSNKSNKYNSSKVIELKNELNIIINNITQIFIESGLDEIRLTKFSMVVYYIVMSFRDYLKLNIKYGVLGDNTSIKALNLEDNHMNKVNNYIKTLQICIDKVNI